MKREEECDRYNNLATVEHCYGATGCSSSASAGSYKLRAREYLRVHESKELTSPPSL